MNYKVDVCRITKKNSNEVLQNFVVNSENSEYEIMLYMTEKYKGFNIIVRPVETINLKIEKEKENNTEQKTIKSNYESYEGYYLEKRIYENDLSDELKNEYYSISKQWKSCSEKMQKYYIDKFCDTPGLSKIKPYCLPGITLPSVKAYLSSQLLMENKEN